MAYWWVNHDQMNKEEISGGYIWCPQNSDGVERVGYANLTLVNEGDVVFSYASQEVGHVGTVKGRYQTAPRPDHKGYSDDARGWQDNGWRVPIEWVAVTQPLSPRQHSDVLGSYFGRTHGALTASGHGKQSMYLSEVPLNVGEGFLVRLGQKKRHFPIIDDDSTEDQIQGSQLAETEKQALIDARIGQGRFRRDVIRLHKMCPVTGVDNPDLLIASHIKAWKRPCTNLERLDPHNGLLLAPHIDKLFDRGFISFSSEGKLLVRDKATEAVLAQWKISLDKRIPITGDAQRAYLDYHRKQHNFPAS